MVPMVIPYDGTYGDTQDAAYGGTQDGAYGGTQCGAQDGAYGGTQDGAQQIFIKLTQFLTQLHEGIPTFKHDGVSYRCTERDPRVLTTTNAVCERVGRDPSRH